MADLAGINLAMQTPFGPDDTIDLDTTKQLIDAYIDAGVHGLVLGSGTGQHPYLTEAECNQLYEVGIAHIDGRCNAICQTSALNMDEVVRRSRHAEAKGADALMILPPYLEGPADEHGLFEFYREIDAEVGIDIVGYNIPQATGLSVSPALFSRLSALSNFNYIKDSAGDLTVHQQYLQDGCRVLNGCDTTTVFALMAGAHGCIWGGANYMPHEAVNLYRLVAEGDHEGALTLWQKMLPSLLHIWTHDYIQCVLAASKHRGYGLGAVRRPLRPLSAESQAKLIATLAPLEA